MNNIVHLLWFAREMAEGQEDIEILIGVYSSEMEARSAIRRLKGHPGFVDFPQGFQVHAYQLNRDHWIEGFVIK
jgi:hypothetical protein